MSGAVEVIDTVGDTVSNVLESSVAEVLPLPAPSCTTPDAMLTVTVPCPEGVMLIVYELTLPLNALFVPFVTVMSAASNPVIASLKAILTGIGESLVTAFAFEVIVTVGMVPSYVRERVVAARLS